jgi:hypothetical protein
MKTDESLKHFVPQVEMNCRCGKPVKIGEADGEPCAIHEHPSCKDFIWRELVNYMQWLRGADEPTA